MYISASRLGGSSTNFRSDAQRISIYASARRGALSASVLNFQRNYTILMTS